MYVREHVYVYERVSMWGRGQDQGRMTEGGGSDSTAELGWSRSQECEGSWAREERTLTE